MQLKGTTTPQFSLLDNDAKTEDSFCLCLIARVVLIMVEPRAAPLMAAALQVSVPVALFPRPVTRKRHKMGLISPGDYMVEAGRPN